MVIFLVCLVCAFALAAVCLLLKVVALKISLREISVRAEEKFRESSNAPLAPQSRDADIKRLCDVLEREISEVNEARRQCAAANGEFTRAVTNVSHDLRTPLTSVSGYLGLLAKSGLEGRQAEYLRIVQGWVDAMKKLTEEELDALADFVFEKIVAEAQAAAEEVAPKNNREDAATSAGKTEVEFPGETACEPESRSESCEPEGAGMETAAVAETAPSDSSEVSATRVANGPEATDYEEDEEDDDAPSMWDKMQRRPILTTLCAILFLLLILAGGTLWNLNRRGITLSDAWNYYFPTEQPSVAETAREATPHSTEEETLPAENNPAPTVVSEKETTPVADPVDVQALPPIAVHRLGRGDRLTLLALEFYGSKDFWVYIYEENKDVMPNPNRLSIGLEVKIPDPRKYAIDADSPSSLAKAKAFADVLNEKFD